VFLGSLQAFGVPDEGFSLTTRPRTQAQWVQQLRSALAGKQLAAVQSRLYRRQSQSHPLRKSQIAALETQRNNKSPKNIMSKPGSYAGAYPRDEQKALPMTNVEKQMLATWRRRRHFVCFVAEEKISEKIVACVAVCLARPEAALPPPFPTRAQQRFYVSNLAVAAPHRRRGVASQLLIQCERLAKAWRHDSIWLQVDNVNEASLSLYEARGYREAEKNMFGFWGSDTRRLLRKDIPLPLSCSQGQLSSSTAIVSGETGPDGVFQWRISHSGDEQQMF